MKVDDLTSNSVENQLTPGSLLRLKSELFWYERRSNESPDRIYLLVDSVVGRDNDIRCEAETLHAGLHLWKDALSVNLVIDGSPTWVEIDKRDFEIL